MDLSNSIIYYRRFLKRKNYSVHTVKNYLNRIKHFVLFLDVPLEMAGYAHVARYIEHLLDKRISPVTINSHLAAIRAFYDYLYYDEQLKITNPVKKRCRLKVPQPLPRYLKDQQIQRLFSVITRPRDVAIFKLMLRCGLRVEEMANLTLDTIDFANRKILIHSGKGNKDRVVYISNDANSALTKYLKVRPSSRARKLFLVEKGTYKAKPLSVRGIQKRMEYYAKKAKVKASCHQLRHTMATQMLNADARLVTVQDLLGHSWVETTQRYCKISNLKVQRDYHNAMAKILSEHPSQKPP